MFAITVGKSACVEFRFFHITKFCRFVIINMYNSKIFLDE